MNRIIDRKILCIIITFSFASSLSSYVSARLTALIFTELPISRDFLWMMYQAAITIAFLAIVWFVKRRTKKHANKQQSVSIKNLIGDQTEP